MGGVIGGGTTAFCPRYTVCRGISRRQPDGWFPIPLVRRAIAFSLISHQVMGLQNGGRCPCLTWYCDQIGCKDTKIFSYYEIICEEKS